MFTPDKLANVRLLVAAYRDRFGDMDGFLAALDNNRWQIPKNDPCA